MFDTMTVTKISAGVLSMFLVLLLGKWAAEEIYHVGGHGEQAYVIEIEEAESNEEAEEIDLGAMLAEADVAKGAKVFKKCSACHKIEAGVNGAGPSLYGVVGRDIASLDGFGYSAPMSEAPGDWTAEALNDFLTKPSSYVSGTSMSFSGLKKIGDRVNLIAYLDSLDN